MKINNNVLIEPFFEEAKNQKILYIKMIDSNREIPLDKLYLLSIEQASILFNIGEKTLRRFLSENENENFIVRIGNTVKIKKRLFAEFLENNVHVM